MPPCLPWVALKGRLTEEEKIQQGGMFKCSPGALVLLGKPSEGSLNSLPPKSVSPGAHSRRATGQTEGRHFKKFPSHILLPRYLAAVRQADLGGRLFSLTSSILPARLDSEADYQSS